MAETITAANLDGALTTTLTEIVSAPAAGTEKRLAITVCNTTTSEATLDVTRTNGGTDRYLAKTVAVAVGKPVVMIDVILTAGRSLKMRASANATLDYVVDVVSKTTTP